MQGRVADAQSVEGMMDEIHERQSTWTPPRFYWLRRMHRDRMYFARLGWLSITAIDTRRWKSLRDGKEAPALRFHIGVFWVSVAWLRGWKP